MTLKKWSQLYNHYKSFYDFKLAKVSYKDLEQENRKSEEWF